MRDTTHIAISPTHRRGTNALHPRTIIGDRILDVQVVEIHIHIFLGAVEVGVIDCRLEKLADSRRDALLGKEQSVASVLDSLALNKVQHQSRLLWRYPHEPCLCSKFHIVSLRDSQNF